MLMLLLASCGSKPGCPDLPFTGADCVEADGQCFCPMEEGRLLPDGGGELRGSPRGSPDGGLDALRRSAR
ncbi:MAG TPA: hypothetical protein QGF58_28095 [Myxococcota bacterium]|nr:hypothetical protein [Myxococcota bacterium]